MDQSQILSGMAAEPAPQSRIKQYGQHSKEQWEAKKAVVHRLYIQEGKPFTQVIDILSNKYNFCITRRQFFRRISEWGFEKNIKDHEMRALADSLENDNVWGVVQLKGRQVSTSNIKRWRKRQGRKASTRTFYQAKPLIDLTDSFSDATEKPETLLLPSRQFSHSRVNSTSLLPLESTNFVPISSKWTDVDIPGSPKMSRFFKALKLEGIEDIPLISIDFSIEVSTESYVYEIEIEEITREEDHCNCMREGNPTRESPCSCSLVVPWKGKAAFSQSDHKFPEVSFDEWSFTHWDFSKGRPINNRTQTRLMRPLSPFPTSQTKNPYRTPVLKSSARHDLVQSSESKQKLYQDRLGEFERVFGTDDLRITDTLLQLAAIYKGKNDDVEQERLLRRTTSILRRSLGLHDYRTLTTYVNLVSCLVQQGKYREALVMHQPIHATILSLFAAGNEFTVFSIALMAAICYAMSNFAEADILFRQVLQMRLSLIGPKHLKTLETMRSMSRTARYLRKFSESEKISSIASQIEQEISVIDDRRVCVNELDLARLLRDQGRHRESKYMALKATERSKIYGIENVLAIRGCCQLGLYYEELGRYEDTLKLYQRSIDHLKMEQSDDHPAIFKICSWIIELQGMMSQNRRSVPNVEEKMEIDSKTK